MQHLFQGNFNWLFLASIDGRFFNRGLYPYELYIVGSSKPAISN